MKITKFFVAALASLAMFSCSNDEEMTNDSKHQNTALSVSVANIMNGTRAVGDLAVPNEEGLVYVDGEATLTINYTIGGKAKTATAKLTFEEGKCTAIVPDEASKAQMTTSLTDKKVTLWNAGTVGTVSVTINNGKKSIGDGTSIEDYVGIPAKEIPAYAEDTPELTNNQGTFNTGGNNGAAEPDYKNYYYYEVTLKPANTEFARIELSDIYYAEPEATRKFSELKLVDVVLDNAIQKKGDTTGKEINFAIADLTKIDWGFYHDQVTENNDMLNTKKGEGLPVAKNGKTQSFAYNFWAKQLPIVRLHFKAKEAVGKPVVAPDQWAFVDKYVKKGDVAETAMTADDFEAGVIYRITSAKLVDKNIVPDPKGDKQFAVVVTVEPVKWTVTDVDAIWHENN